MFKLFRSPDYRYYSYECKTKAKLFVNDLIWKQEKMDNLKKKPVSCKRSKTIPIGQFSVTVDEHQNNPDEEKEDNDSAESSCSSTFGLSKYDGFERQHSSNDKSKSTT